MVRQSSVNRQSDTRESRVLDDNELGEVMDSLRYEDKKTDEEMKQFISEIIACISTGDEEADNNSIETFAATIAAQQNVTRQQAREQLQALRKEYFDEIAKGK